MSEHQSEEDHAVHSEEVLRRSEAALKRTLSHLASAMQATHAGWGRWNFQTGKAEWSDEAKRLIGFASDEEAQTNESWFKRIHPEDRAQFKAHVVTALAENTDFGMEYRVVHDNGDVHWLFNSGTALGGEQDSIHHNAGLVIDITERKRAEEALVASEEKYRTLFETIDEGFAIVEVSPDAHGHVSDMIWREANQGVERHAGIGGWVGKRASSIVPHLEQGWLDALTGVYRTGEPVRMEAYIADLDRWINTYYSRVGGEGSCLIAAVFNDITERKRQEQRQQYLLLLNDALQTAANPVDVEAAVTHLALEHFAADRCYYCTIENGNAIARKDAVRGDLSSVAGIYPLHDFVIFRNAIEAGKPYAVPDVHITDTLDEGLRQICLALGIVSNIIVPVIKQGAAVGLFCLVQSTPREWTATETSLAAETAERTWAAIERARAEEELRASQKRFESIANLVPDLLWESQPDGFTDWYNQRWSEYTGQSFEQAIGWGWTDAIHPDDLESSALRYGEAVRAGKLLRWEHRIRSHDGEYRWFVVSVSPLKDKNGHVIKMYGAATDVHDERVLLETVRQSEERFRLLIEGARDYAMFLINPTGHIVFWSTGAERVFGWSEAEALGQSLSLVFSPREQEAKQPEREMTDARLAGSALDRHWHMRKDGSQFWADGMLMRLDDDSGNVRGFAKVVRDATKEKRAEQAVIFANEELEERVEERTQALEEQTRSLEERTESLQKRTEQLAEMSELRQELLRQLVTAQEEVGARISRDLHDDTGQQITGLLLGLNNLKKRPSVAGDKEAQTILFRLQELAKDVAQKSHRLSFALRPTALDDQGLMGALRNYTETWSTWSGLQVTVESVGVEVSDTRLPNEVETTIYRVAQEALTNVLKYASQEASRVEILVQRGSTHVRVTIEDDGPGFDVEAMLKRPPGQRRLGIFGMQERARLVGGTFDIESTPGEGTTIYLRIPVEAS